MDDISSPNYNSARSFDDILRNFSKRIREFKEECAVVLKTSQESHLLLLPPTTRHQPQQHPAFPSLKKVDEFDNVSTGTSVSLLCREENEEFCEQPKENDQPMRIFKIKGVVAELREISQLTTKLRQKLSPIQQLDDPLFEVLKYLPRKQLVNSVQLIDRRLQTIVCGNEACWPKFKFGRLLLFTDDDFRRTTKYWLFTNRVELKVPPGELAPILEHLESRLGQDNQFMDPVQLVTHFSIDDQQANLVYFLVNLDEKDVEDANEDENKFEMVARIGCPQRNRLFFQLPNKLNTKMAMAAAIYWFRQLTKVHFSTVHFEHFRWTSSLLQFLSYFGIEKFLPISTDSFRTYDPVSDEFLRKTLRANTCCLWDMRASYEFLSYMVGGGHQISNGKRVPDCLRVWGFLAQKIIVDGAEVGFFDSLIKQAKCAKEPNKIIRRIDLNFKQNPAPWFDHLVPGMQLVYRSRTFKIDEDDGTESETSEVRYKFPSDEKAEQKFEVRVECDSDMLDQQMFAFTLMVEGDESTD